MVDAERKLLKKSFSILGSAFVGELVLTMLASEQLNQPGRSLVKLFINNHWVLGFICFAPNDKFAEYLPAFNQSFASLKAADIPAK